MGAGPAPDPSAFDEAAVAARLRAIAFSGGRAAAAPADRAGKRAAAALVLREAHAEGRARIERAFHERRRSGLETARALSALTDKLVLAAVDFVAEGLHRLPTRTTGERIAVVAVGGFGRGEMAPYSDVDLLFLTPYKQTGWGESVIETTLYLLWDLKLKVGHATRTVSDCVRRAGGDMTIRTSLLEKRFLCGAADLYEELDERLWAELFQRSGPEFVEAKLAERARRHERTGGSRYLLEPNVKESKGGLRDLQTLYWIAKYLYRAERVSELIEQGVFTRDEASRCENAAAHLWTVRCGLHYWTGRAQDKLTFDTQIELAERFGYRDRLGRRAVERFMKRYFVAAKEVGELTRIFCAALEQQHKKAPPLLGGLRRLFAGGPTVQPVGDGYMLRDGRLAVADPEIFAHEPIRLLGVLDEAMRRGVLVHPSTLRLMARNRRRADEALRDDPAAQALFVSLLCVSPDPGRALRRLAETGVLGRLLPAFGRVDGLMQFNMYHHYTVDEHTILAIELLQKIRDGALRAEHPIETEIAETLPDRRVIGFALLLHDIGKGLPEDHSIAGERIAREVCPAFGLTPGETEQVAWLVRHHLAMSDVAQKRDVGDPATVRAFADLVRSPTRLKLLYLLTVCDIRAVGPGAWNGWKAQLLRQLYHETRAALTGEEVGVSRADRVAAAQAALRAALTGWGEDEWREHVARFTAPYWLGLATDAQLAHAEMIREMRAEERAGGGGELMKMRVAPSPDRAATRVAFCSTDHPGLFARMAGAFALVGASVVDARAYTTKDGVATNAFWVQDAEGEAYDDPDRLAGLRAAVERTLKGAVLAREALRERRKLRARERPFDVAPSVVFDNAASDLYTVIEVNGRDRVGLLYDLSRALAAESVNIASAIIATYGAHAVDVFYVKDIFGMKITQTSKQRRIEAALLGALERAGEAAGAPPRGGKAVPPARTTR